MNNELLNAAKNEAAREYGYQWYNDALYCFFGGKEGSYTIHKITDRAMEIYAEMQDRYKVTFNQCLREEFLVNTENYPKEYHNLFNQKYQRAVDRFNNIQNTKHTKP